MIFKLAFRELRRSGLQLIAVIWILFLGFLGPLFNGSLRTSVDTYLSERSRQILSADLAVSALRPFTETEIKTLEHILAPLAQSRELQFMTMGKGKGVSTLVEVAAVDEHFPVFGTFKFKDGRTIDSARSLQTLENNERIAWVFPEVIAQLGLAIGEKIGIGESEFKIAAVVADGPGLTRGAGFAPRMYIARKFVEETGLTSYGSQINHRIYLQLPPGLSVETASARVKSTLADPDIFLRTPDDSVRGFERFFKFFSVYLVTVSMIVFALSWISAFYILQIFLQERLKNAAVLLTFGASRLQTGWLYFTEILAVMTLALLLAIGAVAIAFQLIPSMFPDVLPEGFVLRLTYSEVMRLSAVAAASTVALLLPLWARLSRLRLQELLNESAMGEEKLSRVASTLTYLILASVFLALSAWLMDSWKFALELTGGILIVAAIAWAMKLAIFKLFFRVFADKPGLLRLVALQLARSRFGMSLCFITLFMVGLVLNLVPHLLKSAVAEIAPLKGREIPAFFLFNIPESALERLQTSIKSQGAELRYLSPMILGRLEAVNGVKTTNDQFLRFPLRLSYRSERIPSETLLQGSELPSTYDTSLTPQISIEDRFAERNDLKLGDVITFDIQGLPVDGKVSSIRRVKWTTFNPNFFIVFQSGVLDDAPKTLLANVNAELSDAEKVKLQFALIRDFPELSVIDVGQTLARVLEVVRSVIGPVRAAATVAVILSFLILVSVIAHNLRLRHREIDVAKVLGADRSLIRNLIVSEYFLSATVASVLGSAAAVALAASVTQRIFDVPTAIAFEAWIGSIFVIVFATTVIAFFAVSRVLDLRGTSSKL